MAVQDGVRDPAVQDPAVQDPAVQDPAVQDPAVQDPAVAGSAGGRRHPAGRWRAAAVALAVALVLALAALAAVWVSSTRTHPEDSVEVGFARDMHGHHGQAVTMSLLVRERGSDPQVAAFAEEVITGQAEQQGVMLGWLHRQDVPATSSLPPMAWMEHEAAAGGHAAHGGAAAGGAMTAEEAREAMGMASDEELAALGRASGTEADLLYVQLMAPHHEGALEMAQAFLASSDEPQLSWLAEAVVTGQERELRILADLEADLQQRLQG
ncbi:DUF305 domain-containing protein [Quadrisphaera sp. DSM 44207]|uniref:DUF305 domain-containing protein n=1 Tax=Quadrisphaera sp. DSM 44207 TaxID=1881057 RepID=UPI00088D6F80|nr:DUF305 domain-containing protein [Quadrisphaera sp. DSM 44207]SDQ05043.1 Uncharacterized conserved protein, DUF305 family [Quadrisphaera sp. DSM 44207]